MSILLLLLTVAAVSQQVSVTPADRFGWEQGGPGLEAIRSYRYEVEVDGQLRKDALVDVQCTVGPPATGAALFECTAPVPATLLGPHTVRVRSSDVSVPGMDAVVGPWSPPFRYVLRPIPPAPSNMRVIVKPKGLV